MTQYGDAVAVLDFLGDPCLLLEPNGRIIAANSRAKRLIGHGSEGKGLDELQPLGGGEFRSYLRRCSMTTQALPGALVLTDEHGAPMRYRTLGARLGADPKQSAPVVLRLLPAASPEFSALRQRIIDLNGEIALRQRTQALLEESLQQNETLLRELQHRVKNNIQMLIGMFSSASRETRSQEVRNFLDDVSRRLMAVVSAQQIMYQAREVHSVEAAAFLDALCETIAMSFSGHAELEINCFQGRLANDVIFPLSLILNELLTNAYKYGSSECGATIRVDLCREQDYYVLTVADNSPGIPAGVHEKRSSGLGLVRGLCRQIGGSLTLQNDGGARCTVRFEGSVVAT